MISILCFVWYWDETECSHASLARPQVTTSASPPPAPLTITVTVVSNNQTHSDFMSAFVSCVASGGSACAFLDALVATLGTDSSWPTSNAVTVVEDATTIVYITTPPPSPSPGPQPPPPKPPLSPGAETADSVSFVLTVTGQWGTAEQAALNAALAATLGVSLSQVHSHHGRHGAPALAATSAYLFVLARISADRLILAKGLPLGDWMTVARSAAILKAYMAI